MAVQECLPQPRAGSDHCPPTLLISRHAARFVGGTRVRSARSRLETVRSRGTSRGGDHGRASDVLGYSLIAAIKLAFFCIIGQAHRSLRGRLFDRVIMALDRLEQWVFAVT